jgi:2-polyprenyl-6-methoxyphenol hydroxylase-like FAD-dependent oxidoreductase
LKNRRILISGAGIGGLALAYWLRRHGFLPTVVERASGSRGGGYKIDLRGAAVDVAERMGIVDAVRRHGIEMLSASWVDATGKRMATLRSDFLETRGDKSIEIMRGDLNRILHEAPGADVEYLFNDSIAQIAEVDGELDVSFGRAAPRRFDLVVGADGVHSNVRSLTFGDEAGFVDDLGGYYVATFTVPNRLNLDRWDLFYMVPGKTMNVASVRQDADARAVFLFASPPLNYDRRDAAQQKKIVADLFAGLAWEIPWMLGEMRDAPDFFLDNVNQVRMDRWSSGRAVLIGDAGYAPCLASGQGTSLAIVGAYVLAGELKAAAGDHRVAFPRYEQQMREYVEQNQKLGRDAIKAMVLPTRWQIWLLNLMLRLLPYMPWRGFFSRRIKQVVEQASTAIELQEYAG